MRLTLLILSVLSIAAVSKAAPIPAEPETFDFATDRFTLARVAEFLIDKGAAEAVIAKRYGKPNIAALKASTTCLKREDALVLAGYESALIAKDAEDWRSQRGAADNAFDRFMKTRAAILSGAASPYPEFEPAAEAVAQSTAAKKTEAQELFARKARDLIWRVALVAGRPKAYAEGLGGPGRLWLNARLTAYGCAGDAENAAWLKTALASLNWFDIRHWGKEADAAAWLIAEHADGDIELQLLALDRMGKLAVTRDSNPANFAFLWDRVALAQGRPQRYGTQMRCIGKVWSPITPLEEPEKLDERRSWVGLQPEVLFQRAGAKVCGG